MTTTSARSVVRRRLLVWVAGSLVGGALIALPDDDDRVFSFSPGHGPSAVDLLGIVLAVAAWLPVLALIVGRVRDGGPGGRVAAGVAAAAVVALVVTIRYDAGASWLLPVAALVAVQVYVLGRIWTAD